MPDFTCPICGYRTIYHAQVQDHWKMHQEDPPGLLATTEVLARLTAVEEKLKGSGRMRLG